MNFSNLKLLVRNLGPGWIAYRVWKSVSEKMGYWKFKLPSKPWPHFGSSAFVQQSDWKTPAEFFAHRKFFFDSNSLTNSRDWLKSLDPEPQWAEETTARVARGDLHYFSARWFNIGEQPNWFLNPYTNQTIPSDLHFSQINEFGSGDVKCVWEASRFPFVFLLARCFGRTGDQQCAETYWRYLEHWMDNNPPYQGVNWKCGQESGLRFLAALFGLYVFSQCTATTPNRLSRFVRFAAATGNRINKHIAYAISQKNNHGISEAVVLWTIGVLFPEFKQSEQWKAKGLEVLDQLCSELIYADGAFSQHSANYHRVVLHLLAWTVRLATVHDINIDESILNRFDAAINFIEKLVNSETGKVPRYGNDDGAMILNLNHCDYADFRPLVQLCRAVRGQQLPCGPGKWNEDLFWFGLNAKLAETDTSESQEPVALHTTEQGGYHRLKKSETAVFLRAGKFVHRATQSDQMHVDISWRGHNIAIDPGTYSYNGSDHWRSIPLLRSEHHNSVLVDDKEPQTLVSKFLLLPWNESEFVAKYEDEKAVAIEWKRTISFELSSPVIHHRAVVLLDCDTVIVFDSLSSAQPHSYRLGWIFDCSIEQVDQNEDWVFLDLNRNGDAYFAYTSASHPATSDWVRGEENSSRGWFSPRYMELEPAVSFHLQTKSKRVTFQTVLGPNKSLVEKYKNISHSELNFSNSILDSQAVTRLLKANTA